MNIKVYPANLDYMSMLEDKGVITHYMSHRQTKPIEKGQIEVKELYATPKEYGGHKLIHVVINKTGVEQLVYHPDHEEFIIIGDDRQEDLIVTFSLLPHDQLKEKIQNASLSEEDLLALSFRPNQSDLGFFTMKAGFPHAESVLTESDRPPGFFVTESRDLPEHFVDLKTYKLSHV